MKTRILLVGLLGIVGLLATAHADIRTGPPTTGSGSGGSGGGTYTFFNTINNSGSITTNGTNIGIGTNPPPNYGLTVYDRNAGANLATNLLVFRLRANNSTADSSTNNWTMTDIGSTTYVPGLDGGQSFLFRNGTNHIEFPGNSVMNPGQTHDFTLSAWVNYSNYPSAGGNVISLTGTGGDFYNSHILGIDNSTNARVVYNLGFVPTIYYGTYGLLTNNSSGWHHIVASRISQLMTLYVDGVQDRQFASTEGMLYNSPYVGPWGTTGGFMAVDDPLMLSIGLTAAEVSRLYALGPDSDMAGVTGSTLFSVTSSNAVFSGILVGNGGGLTNLSVTNSRALVLCAALTPSGTGADLAEFPVPYNVDGTTSITWNVRRISVRVGTAGGAPAITLEKYTGTSAFSPTTVGTVTLGSGAYDAAVTSSLGTVASGDKLRFNVGTLGTALNWTIAVELSSP